MIINLFSLANHPRLAVAVAGTGFTLGFAPFFIWPLALIMVAVLFTLVTKVNLKQAAILGFIFGFAHHLTALHWLPQSFIVDSGSVWLGLAAGVPALIIVAAYQAVFLTGAIAVFAKLHNYLPKVLTPLLFALLWLTADWLRSVVPHAFPWNLSGYIFADNLQFLQLAANFKIWGLCFIVGLCGALLTKQNWLKTIAILLIIWLQGYYTLANNSNESSRTLTVKLVSPAIDKLHHWDLRTRLQFLNQHAELTKQNSTATELIIWPESAFAFFPDQSEMLLQTMGDLLTPNQLLIAGLPRRELTQNDVNFFNSIGVINHKGKLVGSYDKHILVPFGEYIPFSWLVPTGVRNMVGMAKDYSRGTSKPALKLGAYTAMPLVCYEAIFPQFVASAANESDFLLNLSNDVWFKHTIAPAQHYAMAKVRAVESSKVLIRVTNMGITAVVDKFGREIFRSDSTQPIVANVDIKL